MPEAQTGENGVSRPSDDAIQQQLARILECPQAQLTERSRKFLTYVIAETLAGRASHIKAYSIATDVFGRRNFDAQNDPVVRIEAGRLRRELERYYLLAGPQPVIISIPKGGYVPTFSLSKCEQATEIPSDADATDKPDAASRISLGAATRSVWPWLAGGVAALTATVLGFLLIADKPATDASADVNTLPTIVVERFENITNDRLVISQGITDLIIADLVKFQEVRVRDGASVDRESAAQEEARYALQGSVRQDGDRIRATARLVRRSDGAVIWANNYDAYAGSQNVFEIENSFADEIATAVGQPFGVMFEKDVKPDGAGGWEAYDCSLSYYNYRREMTVKALETAQACLKSVTQASPNNATSLALLSLTYLDQVRFAYKFGTKPSPENLEMASTLAKRAVNVDSRNARALQALMLTGFFHNDIAGALQAGETAYELNPNDTEIAGEYGLRLSMSGKWDTGCDLISKAVSKNAGPAGYYEVGMALCALMRDDFEAAELWSRMSDLEYNPMHRMILTAILGASGKIDQAKRELDWLKTNAPALVPNLEHEISVRLPRPEDRERVFAGLRAAGLPIGSATGPSTN